MMPCPIWGDEHPVEDTYYDPEGRFVVPDSPRAGGGYSITGNEKQPVLALTDAEKARLTTLLVDQRRLGTNLPAVTMALIAAAKRRRHLEPHVRAGRLLRHMASMQELVSDQVILNGDSYAAYAWSESTDVKDLFYLVDYLLEQGWLEGSRGAGYHFNGYISVDGHGEIADQDVNPDSTQAFVAMWFHESTRAAYDGGIRPGIEDAGYEAFRVDRTEHINKIDDEIVSEIRRSRFLVADFTQGEDGARGGVYYEAGFADGLEIPVIRTCRKGGENDLAFDTRQYNHILWETPEDLRRALRNRIGATIGDGPGVTA